MTEYCAHCHKPIAPDAEVEWVDTYTRDPLMSQLVAFHRACWDIVREQQFCRVWSHEHEETKPPRPVGHRKHTPEAVNQGDYCAGCIDSYCRHQPWCIEIRIDARDYATPKPE